MYMYIACRNLLSKNSSNNNNNNNNAKYPISS